MKRIAKFSITHYTEFVFIIISIGHICCLGFCVLVYLLHNIRTGWYSYFRCHTKYSLLHSAQKCDYYALLQALLLIHLPWLDLLSGYWIVSQELWLIPIVSTFKQHLVTELPSYHMLTFIIVLLVCIFFLNYHLFCFFLISVIFLFIS